MIEFIYRSTVKYIILVVLSSWCIWFIRVLGTIVMTSGHYNPESNLIGQVYALGSNHEGYPYFCAVTFFWPLYLEDVQKMHFNISSFIQFDTSQENWNWLT